MINLPSRPPYSGHYNPLASATSSARITYIIPSIILPTHIHVPKERKQAFRTSLSFPTILSIHLLRCCVELLTREAGEELT